MTLIKHWRNWCSWY